MNTAQKVASAQMKIPCLKSFNTTIHGRSYHNFRYSSGTVEDNHNWVSVGQYYGASNLQRYKPSTHMVEMTNKG